MYIHTYIPLIPDNCLWAQSLKKNETKWSVVWTFKPLEEVVRLVGNTAGDAAAAYTCSGLLYALSGESEDAIHVTKIAYNQRSVPHTHTPSIPGPNPNKISKYRHSQPINGLQSFFVGKRLRKVR
jgi:hypothetical protein